MVYSFVVAQRKGNRVKNNKTTGDSTMKSTTTTTTANVTTIKEDVNAQVLSFHKMSDLLTSTDTSEVGTLFSGLETIGFEVWTPQIATYQLRHNENNRNPQVKAYKKYILDMTNKKFGLSGDCIIIDTTGNLLNGQNRCEAIARSGKSQVVVVLRNVLPESKKWENKGCKQTNSNHTQMWLKELYPDFKDDMWGVVCRILAWRNNKNQRDYTDENEAVVEFVKNNMTLLKEINKRPTRGTNVRNNPLFKALEFIFRTEDPVKGKDFCDLVYDGGASVNTPAWALIKWNQSLTQHNKNHGEDTAEIAALQAWDAFKKNKKLKEVKVYEDENGLNPVTGEYTKLILRSEYKYENYYKTK